MHAGARMSQPFQWPFKVRNMRVTIKLTSQDVEESHICTEASSCKLQPYDVPRLRNLTSYFELRKLHVSCRLPSSCRQSQHSQGHYALSHCCSCSTPLLSEIVAIGTPCKCSFLRCSLYSPLYIHKKPSMAMMLMQCQMTCASVFSNATKHHHDLQLNNQAASCAHMRRIRLTMAYFLVHSRAVSS